MTPHETWISECEAARGILDDFGTHKALGYLVGEKFLNFLEVAESDPEWRAETVTTLPKASLPVNCRAFVPNGCRRSGQLMSDTLIAFG